MLSPALDIDYLVYQYINNMSPGHSVHASPLLLEISIISSPSATVVGQTAPIQEISMINSELQTLRTSVTAINSVSSTSGLPIVYTTSAITATLTSTPLIPKPPQFRHHFVFHCELRQISLLHLDC